MKLIFPAAHTLVSTNVTNGTENAMFDAYLNSQTENADLIEVEVDFSNCDSVALFNIDALSVDFELTDNATSTVVQTLTVDLEMSDGEYRQWIIQQLYIYADATLKISIHYLGGTAKCGQCGVGLSTIIGQTQYGIKPGFVDYSIKSTNEFGQTYLLAGNWSRRHDLESIIDYDTIDAAFEDLTAARGIIVFLEANEDLSDYETLRSMGYIQDWNISIGGPTKAAVTLTFQGVI